MLFASNNHFSAKMISRTALVIAHRLSTVASADLIAVIEQGRIVETGTHAQLLQRQGRYSQLVQTSAIVNQ